MATATEVEKAIVKAFVANQKAKGYYADIDAEDESFHDVLREDLLWELEKGDFESDLGTISVVEDIGGGEGDGETRYAVFSVTSPKGEVQFFRVDGYYASWDGTNWDDPNLYEVEAVPVQKIEYQRKK